MCSDRNGGLSWDSNASSCETSNRLQRSSATAACRCRAQRAPASRLFSGVSPEPVEDLGEAVAGPAFGDLVADDMIDMNSFGVNLEPCRRDAVIGSKVRRAQGPARHHLVVLAQHVF